METCPKCNAPCPKKLLIEGVCGQCDKSQKALQKSPKTSSLQSVCESCGKSLEKPYMKCCEMCNKKRNKHFWTVMQPKAAQEHNDFNEWVDTVLNKASKRFG